MKVSPFLATIRNLVLALITVGFLVASVAADFLFRHEIKGKARRDLAEAGFEVSSEGVIRAIRENQLELLEEFEKAEVPFSGTDSEGMTPLHFAVVENNGEAIDELFKRRAQVKPTVDLPSDDGFTPLDRALEQRNFALADKLINWGADINREKSPGLTRLIDAMEKGDSELRDYLLDRQIDVNAKGSSLHAPLALAARDNDLPLMERLISRGASLSVDGSSGNPLLLEAVINDEPGEIELLLKKGADPNGKGSHTHTPIAIAADRDDLATMRLLASAGADLGVEGISGAPLLIESMEDSEYAEVAFLLDRGEDPDLSVDGKDPISIALEKEDGYLRSLLIEHGANLDRTGPSGQHLLFEAFANGDHDWLIELLDSGIPVDSRADDGNTLLMKAVRAGQYEMVDFLISREADFNLKCEDGDTPIEYAVSSGDTAMVRTLILNRPDVDWNSLAARAYERRDHPSINLMLNAGMPADVEVGNGARLFDLAIDDRSIDIARSLLRAGADIGDNFWKALTNEMDDLVLLFLEEGEDPAQPGPDGRTPLDYVLGEKRYGLVQPLLKAGAYENAMYSESETWISRMVRSGNSEIANALIRAGISLGDGRAGDGHSLLAWSIANEMDETTLALIEAGVDVNAIEPSPANSELATRFRDSSRLQYYLKTDQRIRPLMLVAQKKNHKVAEAMVKAGARNFSSKKYLYPILIGSWTGDVRMMQIIYGRNPDYQPRKLVVDLSSQRVQLFENGRVTHSSVVSTGRTGYETPAGTYVITQKNRDHVSNLYDAPMPNFMRLSCSAFGFHTGHIPGYPASHGCIRLPDASARLLYSKCELGDLVVIKY